MNKKLLYHGSVASDQDVKDAFDHLKKEFTGPTIALRKDGVLYIWQKYNEPKEIKRAER